MDLDAFVVAHEPEWRRLEQLVGRGRLSGAEVDELVALYQRVATHLSVVQTRSPDAGLIARLSTLVARARSSVAGASAPAWKDVADFLTVTFPVAVYRSWRWWCGVGTGFSLVSFALIGYVAANPSVQTKLATPQEIQQLVEHDFADYYSDGAAGSFALHVWTNNALLAAITLLSGVLIVPALYFLFENAVNVGIIGGIMVGNGHSGEFFGLISPHGILELTAVFVAAGAGLRLGWTWIDPGQRPRGRALAEETRAAVVIALGLVVVLAASGVIEAFVTPSPLPTWARLAIGVLAEAGFIAYVVVFGGRAARAGLTGDLEVGRREDVAPVA
ncbi:MAG: stage II sporulation protein M [Actinomycetota bacterium]|nr:stage II sporulation protein M [Actinomycetota bacterium]